MRDVEATAIGGMRLVDTVDGDDCLAGRYAPAGHGRDVAARLRELGCDPIAGMVRLAQGENLPPILRARMFAELATYVAPRRKAMELSGPGSGPIEVQTVRYDVSALSNDEQRHLLDLLRKAMPDHGQ